MTKEDWEARCRRCGRCCYEKIEYEGQIYYTDIPCEHLDPGTRLCTVYPDRSRVRPGCVVLTPALARAGFLPGDCPYVEETAGYRSPLPWPEEDE